MTNEIKKTDKSASHQMIFLKIQRNPSIQSQLNTLIFKLLPFFFVSLIVCKYTIILPYLAQRNTFYDFFRTHQKIVFPQKNTRHAPQTGREQKKTPLKEAFFLSLYSIIFKFLLIVGVAHKAYCIAVEFVFGVVSRQVCLVVVQAIHFE